MLPIAFQCDFFLILLKPKSLFSLDMLNLMRQWLYISFKVKATTPIYVKNPLNILFPGTKGQWPWDLVCSIGDVDSTRFAQMMNQA